jgi:precorrin-6Y C5,15-methyltransferase (decarboxylating)
MTVHIIGIGLDGATGLNQTVLKIITKATLLVGSDRHLSYFPQHPAPQIVLTDLMSAIAQIQDYLAEPDSCIVVLVSGDPLFFGLGRLLITKLPLEQLQFHPHISSVQLAFNRLKVPWQDAKIVSIHGRAMDELTQALQIGYEKIAILTDPNNNPRAIAQLIKSLDLPFTYEFWVCENLEGFEERVKHWSPEEIAKENFASLNIVILLKDNTKQQLEWSKLPWLGIDDQYFYAFNDQPGLMTKREIRVLILGELGLQPGQVVWDIGAGTGSVSIEIARLFADSEIYAIEKNVAGTTLIEKNCQRFGVNNIISLHGQAPEILYHLRPPQRIFIGGSGGELRNILGVCSVRMTTGGIIVLAFATLEHLQTAISWVEERNRRDASNKVQSVQWQYRLLQVNLSRSVPIAGLTRFAPLNPVTIMTINQVDLN